MSIGAPQYPDVRTLDMADAGVTLTVNSASIQRLDANIAAGSGAEIVVLPAESQGLEVRIVNTGGEDLTVNDDGGATILTVSTTEDAWLWCDGTAWQGTLAKITT